MQYDITQFFLEQGIPYSTQGKNVTEGWIGTRCPWCINDPSNHLGINLFSNRVSCWRCGKRGSFWDYVKKVAPQSVKSLKNFAIRDFGSLSEVQQKQEYDWNKEVSLPTSTTEILPSHIEYLERRNFSPYHVYRKYNLRSCDRFGQCKYRILIPVYYHGKLVTWTARDITGMQEPAYLNCKKELSIIPIKETLYNFDTVNDIAIVVEGPIDVWRIGDGCISTFGIQYTKQQILLLSKIKRIFIMFDNDIPEAVQKSDELAWGLSPFSEVCQLNILENLDPAELPESEVEKLRKDIFSKVY